MREILHIRLLGTFSLELDGEPCYAIHRARLQSFIACILIHSPAPLSRQQIAYEFWPESSDTQARNNLRKLVHELRGSLPDADRYLYIDTQTIHWRNDAPFTLDTLTFERLLAEAKLLASAHDSDHILKRATDERALIEEAIALYHGDLLPSCYDDWIMPYRERLRQGFIHALERLTWLCEDAGDHTTSIDAANRLLRSDPLHEPTYRRLMRIHAQRGDRASALQVYHTCATRLFQELGVEPDPEIQALYTRLLGLKSVEPATTTIAPTIAAATTPTSNATTLVGRAPEWRSLREAWRRAVDGATHLCLICGEAGIGKTRLSRELQTRVGEQGYATVRTRAYEAGGSLAYAPVIDWLRSSPLQAGLQTLDDIWQSEIARLLPELLVEHQDLPRPLPLQERWQRQRIFEALNHTLLACQQPLLLILDDIQWCDPDTLDWLNYLLDRGGRSAGQATSHQPALLVVLTARPEEIERDHPASPLLRSLQSNVQMTGIDLGPLNHDETAKLAAGTRAQRPNEQDVAALFAFTTGNPLFIVETLASDGWEESVGESVAADNGLFAGSQLTALPPKVHALIAGRLAQLSAKAHQLANLAAVTGRSFSFDLLCQASQLAEESTMLALDELWQRGIIGDQTDGRYDFSHDRIRDVAYAELGPVQRPLLHRRVAGAIERLHEHDLGEYAGQLGEHHERGGDKLAAIRYYCRAADAAAALFTAEHVVMFTDKCLTLLDGLPDTDEYRRQRLELLLSKADVLEATVGFTSPIRKDALDRALELASVLNDSPSQLAAMAGVRVFHAARGDWNSAWSSSPHRESFKLTHTSATWKHYRAPIFSRPAA